MPDLNLLTGRSFTREKQGPGQIEEAPLQESAGGEQFSEEDLSQLPAESEPIRVEVDVDEQPETSGTSFSTYKRPSSWPIVAITAGVIIVVLVLLINPFKSRDGDSGAEDTTQSENVPEETPRTENAQETAQESGQPQQTDTEETQPEERARQVSPGAVTQEIEGAVGISLLGDFLGAIPPDMRLAFFRYSGEGYLAEIMATTGQTFGQFNNNLASISEALVPKTISEEQKTLGNTVVQVRQIRGAIPQRDTPTTAQNALDTNQIRTNLTEKASRGGLQVRQVEVSPLVTSSGALIRPATLKLAGDQGAVVRFVKDVFDSYYNVALNKITISRLNNDLNDSRVNAVIDLDVISK